MFAIKKCNLLRSAATDGSFREMKVSIAYAGVRLEGAKRRVLENKVARAGFEPARKFLARKEGVIAETYNVDEVRLRVLDSDGGAWIRPAEDAIFQLDHIPQQQGHPCVCGRLRLAGDHAHIARRRACG